MNPEPVIQISALEHHAYCPRQCALIHVDGVWSDNAHTIRGTRGHRRVDSGQHRIERGRRVLRALPLWSESLGLTGRADAVEVTADDQLVPVEYKIGVRHGDAADIQLCAQALCLEEMTGRPVATGALWFSGPRRRTKVAIDAALRARTRRVIDEVRTLLTAAHLPPAVDDERCGSCQLLGHCLPGAVAHPNRVLTHLEQEVFACASSTPST